MAKIRSTFVRLCREEFEALTRDERQEYLLRAFIQRRAQMERNKKLIEWHKKFLRRATPAK